MKMVYDLIVLGLGAMGSAALYQSSLTGKRVLGIDQFTPPHVFGSSHGETRITRCAIGEGEAYVPLALRSHELWREIERKTGKQLLFEVGGLVIGRPSADAQVHGTRGFFKQTVAAATRFNISHQILENATLRKRFPQFQFADDDHGYFEPGAGYVRPEDCMRAQLALAKQNGAAIRFDEKVLELTETASGIKIKTPRGEYHGDQVILTAGPWIADFLEGYGSYFKVCRQVLYWFAPRGTIEPFLPDRSPVFIWPSNGLTGEGIYGFPAVDGPDGGIKIATEQYDIATTPEAVTREVTHEEIETMYANHVEPRLPMISSKCIKAVTCLYTMAPEGKFVIQRDPKRPAIVIASPCSGHGFKHSAAIGEALAQLVSKGSTTCDLSSFRFGSDVEIGSILSP